MFSLIYYCIKTLSGEIINDGVVVTPEDTIYPAQEVGQPTASEYGLPFQCEACKFSSSNNQSTIHFTEFSVDMDYILKHKK